MARQRPTRYPTPNVLPRGRPREYSKEFIASDFTATWLFALDHCNQHFDGLAIVLDQQENDRLQEAITVGSHPTNYHWIGASKMNNTWYWNTKERD
ncbi:hypothetical protein DPMN_173306, partial [Dreissena polymorpha]